jgi:hypothetical protein
MRELGIEWIKILGRVWFGEHGYIRMKNIADTDLVPDDHIHIYSKGDNLLYKDDTQTEHTVTGGGGGSGDAADITYTPNENTDWDGDVDPGDVNDALDQLAERIDDIEGGSGVPDGDKGDITVSSAGTNWQIDANAVGATEIANGAVTEAKQTLADNTTGNATTSAHGYVVKAVAPSAGIRSVVAIDNSETIYKVTALFDNTNPADVGTTGPGTSLIAARRDHIHGQAGAVDSDDVTYAPTTVADWDGGADPGDVEQALDQLAERIKDVEDLGASATITVEELDGTPSVGTVDTIIFDQSDGFVVTDNSDGSVTVGHTAVGSPLQGVFVMKPSDTARTTDDTLSNDPHLTLPILANEKWAVRAIILVTVASATPDIKFQWVGPAGSAGMWMESYYVQQRFALGANATLGMTANAELICDVIIANGVNAGNLTFQWAQNTSSADATTVKATSYLVAYQG